MEEIWKDIKDYEGLYQVSNKGRVKSLARYDLRGNFRQEKFLKPHKTDNGYLQVSLYNNRKRKRFMVHVLVANAFIENPNNLPEVNHIDENKTNNIVQNLEFCDRFYNAQYSLGKKIKCLDLKTNETIYFSAIREAARYFDTGKSSIRNSLFVNKSPYKNKYIFTEIKE